VGWPRFRRCKTAFYEYESQACGHRWEHYRQVAQRNDPSYCPHDGNPGRKVLSVPVIHWPRNLWNQWSDVYPDVSPREMAKRKDVERYDPNLPHKPEPKPVDLKQFLPTPAEAEGAASKHPTPVEGEGPYQ